MNVLFRCDGSVEIGMGHVVRCLALAQELHNHYKCNIAFAMRGYQLGINEVSRIFPVIVFHDKGNSFDYRGWLKDCIKKTAADTLILDVRDGMSRAALRDIKQSLGVKVATVEDPEDKRLEADLAFYPPVPQVKRMDWTGFVGELKVGWEWIILRKEFAGIALNNVDNDKSKRNYRHASIPVVLVTMGGSDPQGMTLKVVNALETLDESFDVIIVIGMGFQYEKELDNLLSHCKHHFDVHKNVQNMAKLMSQCDFAVASFGVTAYELAAIGVPAIYICLTQDHAESATLFEKEGIAISLGEFVNVTDLQIVENVKELLKNRVKALEMATRAGHLVDAHGLERFARTIINKFQSDG